MGQFTTHLPLSDVLFSDEATAKEEIHWHPTTGSTSSLFKTMTVWSICWPPSTIRRASRSVSRASLRTPLRGVLVEHGYVDKDYRSTFYNFYARMGRQYRPDCVRLHFFDGAVWYDEARTDIGVH